MKINIAVICISYGKFVMIQSSTRFIFILQINLYFSVVVVIGLTANVSTGLRDNRTNVDTHEGIASTPQCREPTTTPLECSPTRSTVPYTFLNSF